MARPTDKALFLSALSQLGGRVPNGHLRATLRWTEDKYWRTHQALFDDGAIERGRGPGGTVLLVHTESKGTSAPDAAAGEPVVVEARADPEDSVRELNLYAPLRLQLQKHWAIRRQLDECHCEVIALQGRKDTGGSWSRPDLCVIGSRQFEYYPQRVFELHTFEVKAANDVTIKGVLEALAHREAATRSYVLYHTAGQEFDDYPESARIQELSGRHGVGLLAARDVDDIESWDEIVPAQRSLADPEAINTFIGRMLSEEAKRKIRKWFSW